MPTPTQFDKALARQVRRAMQMALDSIDGPATFAVGHCSYFKGEATFKIECKLKGGVSMKESDLIDACRRHQIDPEMPGLEGEQLTGYSRRASKRPWLYSKDGGDYCCDTRYAKFLFAERETPATQKQITDSTNFNLDEFGI